MKLHCNTLKMYAAGASAKTAEGVVFQKCPGKRSELCEQYSEKEVNILNMKMLFGKQHP